MLPARSTAAGTVPEIVPASSQNAASGAMVNAHLGYWLLSSVRSSRGIGGGGGNDVGWAGGSSR
jgi:hypothetical protein